MTVVGTLSIEPDEGDDHAYRIEVDGNAKGEVRGGQGVRLALAPGTHVVRARRGLGQSPELSVHLGPAATVRVRVTTVPGGLPGRPRIALSAPDREG